MKFSLSIGTSTTISVWCMSQKIQNILPIYVQYFTEPSWLISAISQLSTFECDCTIKIDIWSVCQQFFHWSLISSLVYLDMLKKYRCVRSFCCLISTPPKPTNDTAIIFNMLRWHWSSISPYKWTSGRLLSQFLKKD